MSAKRGKLTEDKALPAPKELDAEHALFRDRLAEAMQRRERTKRDLRKELDCTDREAAYYVSGERIPETLRYLQLERWLRVPYGWLTGKTDETPAW